MPLSKALAGEQSLWRLALNRGGRVVKIAIGN